MTARNLVIVTLALVLFACQDSNLRNRAKSLDTSISEYSVGLRWSMVDVIEHFHKPKEGRPELLDRDALEKVRVTSSSILEQTVNEEMTEAQVTGEISYYTTDTGTLKKKKYTQEWWYNEENESWFIGSDYLDFE